MPKIWQSYIKKDVISGLWKITEDDTELRQMLYAFDTMSFSSAKRNSHWLASRVLLQELLAELGFFGPYRLLSGPTGKPMLDIPGIEISISHSGEYAAVAISEKNPVGLDIEMLTPRISRIYPKFMNGPEIERLKDETDIPWMYLVWSAKESLFKYYGHGELDFRQHLHIEQVHDTHLSARIEKGNYRRQLTMPYKFLDNYVITWALEEEGLSPA